MVKINWHCRMYLVIGWRSYDGYFQWLELRASKYSFSLEQPLVSLATPHETPISTTTDFSATAAHFIGVPYLRPMPSCSEPECKKMGVLAKAKQGAIVRSLMPSSTTKDYWVLRQRPLLLVEKCLWCMREVNAKKYAGWSSYDMAIADVMPTT